MVAAEAARTPGVRRLRRGQEGKAAGGGNPATGNPCRFGSVSAVVITGVRACYLDLPLPAVFWPTWIPGYPQRANRLVLYRVETDEGIVGHAASVAFQQEARGIVDLIRPFLIGRDPTRIEEILQILRSATYLGFRLWFLEVAMWDILGKKAGLPVYRLLGGYQDRVRAYASTGELRPPEQRAEDALRLKEMGFRGIKLRFRSPNPRDDLKVVEAVRRAVGDDMAIMVDANQGWLVRALGPVVRWDLGTAVAVCRELARYGVEWVEEPLDKHDYEGLARLREKVDVRIAGGEMNADLHEMRELITRGCLDVIQPDVTLGTGILNGKKVAGMAEAFGLDVCPHTWTNGIGLIANLHLMGACPNATWCEYPIEPPGWTPEARDMMLAEPVRVDRDGTVRIPQGPGLGLELDEEVIARYGQWF